MKNNSYFKSGRNPDTSRRNFLKLGGIGIAMAGLTMVGCNDGDGFNFMDDTVFDLGQGDVGVLNYAYALEQLEADFYTKVVNNFTQESPVLKRDFHDLYHHEVIHRDFSKPQLAGPLLMFCQNWNFNTPM